ncbi:MAG TPA: GNAT family N-acetyltransferase [Burkholderiales bacterium]|nr:GNAT family N-acetyltransferase [Burkholderiales bacterium]
MTANTEHPLGPEHVAGCFALSKSANWNQNEADWRLMLEIGRGWGLSLADGTLVASTLVLPYGDFAWISMVLVHPDHRRQGHASRLLRVALADLRRRGLTPVLDATPAGREVYRQEGFRDTWTFKRFQLKSGTDQVFPNPPLAGSLPPLTGGRQKTWSVPDFALDREAFGADRTALLRALQKRLPQAALGHPDGFVLGREGREARQIGPLVARDEATAMELLQAALAVVPAPVYLDVADHAPAMQRWLQEHGFAFQRPFTRMVHGADRAPGNEKLVYLVAGPELG